MLVITLLLILMLVPLFAPQSLLYILPGFGVVLISNAHFMVKFDKHYQSIALLIGYIGLIHGLYFLPHILKKLSRNKKVMALCIAFFIAFGIVSPHTGSVMNNKRTSYIPTKMSLDQFAELSEIKEKLLLYNSTFFDQFWSGSNVGPHFVQLQPQLSLRYGLKENRIKDRDIFMFTKDKYIGYLEKEEGLDTENMELVSRLIQREDIKCSDKYKYIMFCFTKGLNPVLTNF